METKETIIKTQLSHSYIEDSEYYKYIFKKTEKIVCALFFILRSNEYKVKNDFVLHDLEDEAGALLDIVLMTLQSTPMTQIESVRELKFALVAFEAKLRLACAARILSTEYFEVFVHEIDSVQRVLRRYLEPKGTNPLFDHEEQVYSKHSVQQKRKERSTGNSIPAGTATVLTQTYSGKSRRERVLDILRDKGEATIKDITEVVKDCSEKTIQRELMGLISDNIIVREGERRWSKYKLV